VPRHVARPVTQLFTPLVVDYFTYVARLGASALRAACRRLLRLCRTSRCASARRAARHAACRRLLRLRRTSGCASARLADRHAARPRLLRLCRAFGCLGTSRGSSPSSSRCSSSTTLPTPRIRVPRHVMWLVTRLVAPLIIDYFTYAACPSASACLAARHVARR
jgi:hypothetical protein